MLSVANKVGHSLRHPFDECAGLWVGGFHHLNNPFLAKQLISGILSLVESVCIEKECASRGKIRLLCRKRLVGHGTNGQITMYGKGVSIDKWCFMSGITVAQMPSAEVEHPGKDSRG